MTDNKISKAPPPAPKLPNSAPHLPGLDLANALRRISKMSDREKADLSIDAARKNVRARDYRTVKPDAKHWALEVDWVVDDAALLLVDLDPREGLGLRLKEYLADSSEYLLKSTLKRDELALFRHAETILRRANGANSTLRKTYETKYEDIIGNYGVWITTPADFAAWALTCSPVDVPEWMTALVSDAAQQYAGGKTWIDAEHDQRAAERELRGAEVESKELIEARATIERQAAEIARLQKANAELEPGERKTYRKLCKFYAKRYAFDPTANKSPAPGKMRRHMETDGITMDPDTVRKVLRTGAEDE